MPAAAQYFPTTSMLKRDKGIDLVLCQCSGCGLVQLNNDPVPYFCEVIRAVGFSESMVEFRKQQFQNFVHRFQLKNKKVLEIGCGRGEYLSIMKQCGAIASGIESSQESVIHCQQMGLDVTTGYLDCIDFDLPHKPYDAFFIMSFLEHMPDPNAALLGMTNNLCASGVGIVEVPNFDMILKHDLFSEFITDHLFYFTKKTLVALLERNGYEVLSCSPIWHDYILSAIVKKRTPLNLDTFQQKQIQLKTQFDQFLSNYPDKSVATWGAGHQALAILSLAGLADRIKYVVDSAPFKQGKFTHATHIPIVSPEYAFQYPPESFVVMAASYSDEVVKIIQNKFEKNLKITVLRDFGIESV